MIDDINMRTSTSNRTGHTGRTTRLILSALSYLSEGYHVVVVAHPANEAFRIVDEIHHYADEMGVPSAVSESNEMDFMSDVPLLYIRPFGWQPMIMRRSDPQPKVLIDHSAVFERTMATTVSGPVVHPFFVEEERVRA